MPPKRRHRHDAEERAREILRAAYVAETGDDEAASYYWSMAFEDMTVEDRYAITAMLSFADAEAAAMRERAVRVCDGMASSAAAVQAVFELAGSEAPTKAIQRECAETLAAAIRALPATGEVGRG